MNSQARRLRYAVHTAPLSALLKLDSAIRLTVMLTKFLFGAALGLAVPTGLAADVQPAPQQFRQEIAQHYTEKEGAPMGAVQLLDCPAGGPTRTFAAGQWYEFRDRSWHVNDTLKPRSDDSFTFADNKGQTVQVPLPWREVRQLLRAGTDSYVVGANSCFICPMGREPVSPRWPGPMTIRQLAVSSDGVLYAASSDGLWGDIYKQWLPT